MPIIKKNEVAPERPVVIVIYGTPGSGKTSLATTASFSKNFLSGPTNARSQAIF